MKLKKVTRLVGLASFTVMASHGALAQPYTPDAGWYAGGNVGQSRATIDDPRIRSGLLGGGLATSSISDRDHSTGGKLFGGYQFNRNFAVEAGYFDFGKFGFTANTSPAGTLNGNIKLNGVNLDAVGILPLTERLSALGRVGVISARARDSFVGTGAVSVSNPNPSKRDTGYKIGAGLQYALNDSWNMRAELERNRINDALGNKGHIDLFTVGLVYRFGGKVQQPAPQTYIPEPVQVAAAPAPAPVVVAPPAPPPPPPPPMRTKVSFSADSLFDFDKSSVMPAGKQALDKFAADLKGSQYESVLVTGHTDRIGSYAYNQKLSERRAEAVRAYLAGSAGIAFSKITVKGVDGANPVTKLGQCKGSKPTAKLKACLQPDRRVDVEVTGIR